MTDSAMPVVLSLLVLGLPLSALVARRLPIGDTLKLALAWVAIFGVLVVIVSLWQSMSKTG